MPQLKFFALVLVACAFLAYVNSDCIQCDSAVDARCATNPEQIMIKSCVNSSSMCYTRILDGRTIRGCASDLDNATAANCRNEMECLICSYMEGCNRNIFPVHRANCLQCEGNISSPCALEVFARPAVCPIYKLGDRCFIRHDGKGKDNSFQRGCLSSAHEKRLCLGDSNCYTCEGAGCNFLEANSTQIPLARDSASMFGYSLVLLASSLLTRFL